MIKKGNYCLIEDCCKAHPYNWNFVFFEIHKFHQDSKVNPVIDSWFQFLAIQESKKKFVAQADSYFIDLNSQFVKEHSSFTPEFYNFANSDTFHYFFLPHFLYFQHYAPQKNVWYFCFEFFSSQNKIFST
jgi:hypothetical protein